LLREWRRRSKERGHQSGSTGRTNT
jgi:hypothetical protein